MTRRALERLAALGCLFLLGGLYICAWVLTFEVAARPRPLQMHKRRP